MLGARCGVAGAAAAAGSEAPTSGPCGRPKLPGVGEVPPWLPRQLGTGPALERRCPVPRAPERGLAAGHGLPAAARGQAEVPELAAGAGSSLPPHASVCFGNRLKFLRHSPPRPLGLQQSPCQPPSRLPAPGGSWGRDPQGTGVPAGRGGTEPGRTPRTQHQPLSLSAPPSCCGASPLLHTPPAKLQSGGFLSAPYPWVLLPLAFWGCVCVPPGSERGGGGGGGTCLWPCQGGHGGDGPPTLPLPNPSLALLLQGHSGWVAPQGHWQEPPVSARSGTEG